MCNLRPVRSEELYIYIYICTEHFQPNLVHISHFEKRTSMIVVRGMACEYKLKTSDIGVEFSELSIDNHAG